MSEPIALPKPHRQPAQVNLSWDALRVFLEYFC